MNQKQTVSLEIVLKGITTTDKEAVTAAKAHWDRVAKPLNSLGVLEEDICRIAGVKRREGFSLDRRRRDPDRTGSNSSCCQKYGGQAFLRLPDGGLRRSRGPSCRRWNRR